MYSPLWMTITEQIIHSEQRYVRHTQNNIEDI